ncbi:MAG: hypothetical protein CMN30_26150 [Sandaracinus sp.]|nr:hypothetical protein [Sandaracinus sp.]
MSDPHRGFHGVTERVRPLEPDELQLVSRRRAEHLDVVRKLEFARARELLALALMFFVGGFAAWIVGFAPLRLAAALAAALAAVGGLVAWVRAKKAVDEYVGPWSAPDPEWRVHEARIRARSLFHLASEDEDYTTWLLFEIPGEPWVAVDDLWLPADVVGARLAAEEVVVRWLEPRGECLGAEGHGDPIPRHGALELGDARGDGDAFARAIVAGHGWPVDDEAGDVGEGRLRRVPADQLPAWVQELAAG